MQHGAKKTRAHAAAAQNYAKGGMVRDPNRPDIPVVGTRVQAGGEDQC